MGIITELLAVNMPNACKAFRTMFNKTMVAIRMGFPGGPVVKNPPAMQEMWVRFLGQEDPLEKEMATHSSILAWKIPWTKEPGGLSAAYL